MLQVMMMDFKARNMREVTEGSLNSCIEIVKKNGYFDTGFYEILKSFINAKTDYLDNIQPYPILR